MSTDLRQHFKEQQVSETLKHLDRVLESVHVIPKDNPVPDVPVGVVRKVAQAIGHYDPRDVRTHFETVIHDGRLNLAEHTAQVVLGFVELLLERTRVLLLVLGNLL